MRCFDGGSADAIGASEREYSMFSWDNHDEFDKVYKTLPQFHKDSPPKDFIRRTLYVDYSQGTSFSHVMTHHDAILGGDPQQNQKHR